MLEVELDNYKRKLYESNKMVESMKMKNNCLEMKNNYLEMKIQEQMETSKYQVTQDTSKLKFQNKKLAAEINELKGEYEALKADYNRMLSIKMSIEDSFSLNYSNIAEKWTYAKIDVSVNLFPFTFVSVIIRITVTFIYNN